MWRASTLASALALLLCNASCFAIQLQQGGDIAKGEGVDHSLATKTSISCQSPQLTYVGDPVDFTATVTAKPSNESGEPLVALSHCHVVFTVNKVEGKPVPLKPSDKDPYVAVASYSTKDLAQGIAEVSAQVLPLQLKDLETGDIWGYTGSSSGTVLHVVMPKPEPPPPQLA
jgi:hypothetical protein